MKEAYKKYLQGVPLENTNVSDDVKIVIKEFELYQQNTAYQISQMTDKVTGDQAAVLRHVRKLNRRSEKENPNTAVTCVIRQHLDGIAWREINRR